MTSPFFYTVRTNSWLGNILDQIITWGKIHLNWRKMKINATCMHRLVWKRELLEKDLKNYKRERTVRAFSSKSEILEDRHWENFFWNLTRFKTKRQGRAWPSSPTLNNVPVVFEFMYLVSLSSCWQPSITLTKQPMSCKSLTKLMKNDQKFVSFLVYSILQLYREREQLPASLIL